MPGAWNAEAERDLILASWAGTSTGPVRPDWPKTIAIMNAWGYDFSGEALKSRGSKTILKDFKSKQETAIATIAGNAHVGLKASPAKRKAKAANSGDSPVKKSRSTPKTTVKTETFDEVANTYLQDSIEGDDTEDNEGDNEDTASPLPHRRNPRRSVSQPHTYKEEKLEGERGEDSDSPA
ncbi:hypothetical protein MGG_03176 [Pyricularia oryzae 70-15]|uniref:Uncharacterized protein n=3 Tax=Pyricularia oryzae TaxID=318829 RepID=G4NAF0_PYRO7|nr:uncharacterized protein MGG_03176 [Pyricularia oryzae 70-15]EHA50495.1 hypothetical protein MGG_03176 [Pyricularia oryzae 70-15]ELQ43376.1 hypothetical protein OOU_Y34scaffold00155g20 [Pyricularia oryzae Y34]KAI7931524.1 hypothetical protein M9X92_000355 [Pyricularia oryzae]KAI7931653.1 hypothetical protein M0657_001151 [Pyricularia oryzae]